MKRTPDGDPVVRIVDGPTVVVEFAYSDGRWIDLPAPASAREFRAARHERPRTRGQRGAALAHVNRKYSRKVRLIGDEPFETAYRPEWDDLSVRDIPGGVRHVYDFGDGHPVREETLYPALDAVLQAGQTQVDLGTLHRIIERQQRV